MTRGLQSFNHNYSVAHDMRGEGGVQAVISGTGLPPGGIERTFGSSAAALLWLAEQYRLQADLIVREVRTARGAPGLILPHAIRQG